MRHPERRARRTDDGAGRAGETTYRSLEKGHSAVLADLDERYVGRKHYDDRSRTLTREDERSFRAGTA